MSEADPARFGYWSREEVLRFLGDLLEIERVGANALAAICRAADIQLADIAFESELAQGAICVLLRKEIAARGGADPLAEVKEGLLFPTRRPASSALSRSRAGTRPSCRT